MAKSRKPYPGMGPFVLLLDYSGTWVPHMGAKSLDKLKAERRRLPQWPDSKVKIVENA